MTASTYGEKWHGFTAAPRPPPDIELEAQEAIAAGDDVRLRLAPLTTIQIRHLGHSGRKSA